jgi:hypothetical protein
LALSDIVENLTQHQEFYSSRLRKFAEQMGKATDPADATTFYEVLALQAAALRSQRGARASSASGIRDALRPRVRSPSTSFSPARPLPFRRDLY